MGRIVGVALAGLLLVGCAATRVVPVPAAGVILDPSQRSASLEAEGVQLIVRPSAWRGSPSYLPSYVTPFHLGLANGSLWPLRYDYGDLRLFDDARFQYTALPPAEVGRLLRWSRGEGGILVAAAGSVSAPLHWRHRPLFWDPWWWDPWWWGPPYSAPPSVGDVITRALPVGTLQAGARTEGFVYFPLLRREASRLTFEFHYRLGDAPRVLILPFAVDRAAFVLRHDLRG